MQVVRREVSYGCAQGLWVSYQPPTRLDSRSRSHRTPLVWNSHLVLSAQCFIVRDQLVRNRISLLGYRFVLEKKGIHCTKFEPWSINTNRAMKREFAVRPKLYRGYRLKEERLQFVILTSAFSAVHVPNSNGTERSHTWIVNISNLHSEAAYSEVNNNSIICQECSKLWFLRKILGPRGTT